MHRITSSFAVVVALVASATQVGAQPARPERPYRGLFAGDVGDTSQLLTASASLGAGWDDNLAADALGRNRPIVTDLNTSNRGVLGQFTGALSYSLNVTRMTIAATAATSVRYYPSLDKDFFRRDNLSMSVGAPLGAGFSANAMASYGPYNLLSLYPALFAADDGTGVIDPGDPLIDPDSAASTEHFVSYGGGLGYTRILSPRTTFSANYAYRSRYTSFVEENDSERGRFNRHSIGGRLTHNLSKGLSLRAGYRHVGARYVGNERAGNHIIDAGVDFNRSLSFSRRTSVSFGTGSTATAQPDNLGGGTRFRLTGSARLNYELGRTWTAGAAYNRGAILTDAWPEPVFSDSVSLSIGGLVARRVQVSAVARAVDGRAGFARQTESQNGFNAYQAGVSVGYALTRYVNLGLVYSFYRNRFGSAIDLAPGFANEVDRHSVRANVSVWAPLFQRARRPDATR
jgi:hypothetical protein